MAPLSLREVRGVRCRLILEEAYVVHLTSSLINIVFIYVHRQGLALLVV